MSLAEIDKARMLSLESDHVSNGDAAPGLALVFGATGYVGSHLTPRLAETGRRTRAAGRNREVMSGMGAALTAQLAACAGLLERLRADTIDAVEHTTATGSRLRATATEAETRIAGGLTRALDILAQSVHTAQAQVQTQPNGPGDIGEAVRLSTDTALRTSRQIERVEKVLMGLLENLQRRPEQDDTALLAMLDRLGSIAERLETTTIDAASHAGALPPLLGRLSQIHTTLESAAIRVEDDIQRVGLAQAAAFDQSAMRMAAETDALQSRFDAAVGALTTMGAELRLAAAASADHDADRVDRHAEAAAALDQALQTLSRGLDATMAKAQSVTASMASLPVFLDQGRNALVDFTLDWTSRCEAVLGRLEAISESADAGSQTAQAMSDLQEAGLTVLHQMAEAAARIETQGAALASTQTGLGAIAQDLTQTGLRYEAAAQASESALLATPPLHAMVEQAREALAAWAERSGAALKRLEDVPPPADSRPAVAAAIAELRQAGAEALRPLLAAAHGLDRHAGALGGVNQGLSRLTTTLARSEDRAEAMTTRTGQMLEGLEQLPPLLEASQRSLVDWALRCESLLARLDAQPALLLPAQPDLVADAPSDDRSVASRLLAGLAPDDAADLELTQALRRLDGVETEVGHLLRDAEGLAEKVIVGSAPVLPQAVSDEAPALLEGLQETIARLQSVATALAMAADGPAPMPAKGSVRGRAA